MKQTTERHWHLVVSFSMAPKKGKSNPKVNPTPEQMEAMGDTMSAASLYALYKQAIDRFRASVLVNSARAYRDLVYEIKEASASFVSDVVGADLDTVIASISSLTATLQLCNRHRNDTG